MDVKRFVDELLSALAATRVFERVALQTEGPIASGRVYAKGSTERFLRVYFNEKTGTMAFALISEQPRIWGIDFDNRRGWHLHPVENPAEHRMIEPLSVSGIVLLLEDVLSS
ncbi:MAG: hypothetical protein WAW20_14240 [Anaerolineae bacterium]